MLTDALAEAILNRERDSQTSYWLCMNIAIRKTRSVEVGEHMATKFRYLQTLRSGWWLNLCVSLKSNLGPSLGIIFGVSKATITADPRS